ncbi:hypothetical protein G9A89_000624 [Geosiphon pyriformis]|nr:hypothetical protein G9A89_000624 [Geosiphon pyriformis]
MYLKGQGVKQSNEQAMKWFRAAAEQGHVIAQFNLARVEQSNEEALKWYRAAAEQGHAIAQYDLDKCIIMNEALSNKMRVLCTVWDI